MFVVIFEVQPKPESWDAYLAHAAALKPDLEQIDGFLANERFASRTRPGWLVSLSTWRDEKALIRWRTQDHHHAAQADGRAHVFQDYRLRVGEVTADSAQPPDAPLAQQRLDATAGDAKAALLAEGPAAAPGAIPPADATGTLVEWDRFDSISNPVNGLELSFWHRPPPLPAPATGRRRIVRIIRAYGMFDRSEAPQYYPPTG